MKRVMLSLLLITFISTFDCVIVNADSNPSGGNESAQAAWYNLYKTEMVSDSVPVKFEYVDIIGYLPSYVIVTHNEKEYRVNTSVGYDYTADNNGSYDVVWYDTHNDPLFEGTFTISNIDKLVPEVSYTEQSEFGETTELTFTAVDPTNSYYPVASSPNANDFEWSTDFQHWTKSDSYKVTYDNNFKEDNHTVYCRDKVGNIAYFKKFCATKVDIWAPTLKTAILEIPANANKVYNSSANITYTNTSYVTVKITADDISKEYQAGTGLKDSNMESSGFDKIELIDAGSGATVANKTNIKATANGIYSYVLLDKVGNRSKVYTYNVNCFDREPPVYNIFQAEKVGYVEVSLTASDNQSGLHEDAYSSDDGKTWTKFIGYKYTSNGTYKFKFRDALGNISEGSIEVTKCDTVKPTAKYEESDWGKVSNIKILCEDDVALATDFISWDDGKTWNKITVKTYDKNGTYKVKIRDAYLNILDFEFNVTKVDTTAPTLSLSYSNTVTDKSVDVVASCSDKESGLADSYIKMGNGGWGTSTKFTISSNGDYVITVKDKAGNETRKGFTISCIDKENPEVVAVKKTPDDAINCTKVTVTVQAKDNGPAGLASEFISWDGGKTWSKETTKTFTSNQDCPIIIRDSLGHLYTTSVSITEIKKTTSTPTNTNTDKNKNNNNKITVVKSDEVATNYNNPQTSGKTEETLYIETKSGIIEIKKSNIDNLIKKYDTIPLYVGKYEDMAIIATADGVYNIETGEEVSDVNTDDVSMIDDDFTEPVLGFTNDPDRHKSNIDTTKLKKLIIPIAASCLAIILIVVVLILVWTKPKNK